MSTVEENKQFYTERHFQKAKKARELYHALSTPSIDEFKAVLRMNMISNNIVTLEDVKIAEKIFGPDIGSLKGKTTRQKLTQVVPNLIEIPKELVIAHRDITLCIDGMKVNGMPFLTTISKNLYYRTATYLQNHRSSHYKDHLADVIRLYKRAQFKVKEIRADNEFKPLMGPIEDEFDATMNFAVANEHVPEAERNNRTIKERNQGYISSTTARASTTNHGEISCYGISKKIEFFPGQAWCIKILQPKNEFASTKFGL